MSIHECLHFYYFPQKNKNTILSHKIVNFTRKAINGPNVSLKIIDLRNEIHENEIQSGGNSGNELKRKYPDYTIDWSDEGY